MLAKGVSISINDMAKRLRDISKVLNKLPNPTVNANIAFRNNGLVIRFISRALVSCEAQ